MVISYTRRVADYSEFADWLRQAIDRRGMRQSQVAYRIDVSPGTVSRWLSGTSRPDPAYCGRLAELFGEPLHKIYRLAGHPAEYDPPPRRQPLSLRDAMDEYQAFLPVEVPVVEQLASAGSGQIVAVDYVYLPPQRTPSRNILAIAVKGQSMEPEIRDGDVVVFDRDADPKAGDVVVASVDDEVLVKRLERRSGHLVLVGNNGAAVSAEGANIAGVVIQSIREWRR